MTVLGTYDLEKINFLIDPPASDKAAGIVSLRRLPQGRRAGLSLGPTAEVMRQDMMN